MLSVFLALGAALSWGVSDFMGGLFSRRLPLVAVVFVTQLVGFVGLLVVALLQGPPNLDTHSALMAMGASATGMVGIASLYRGMAVGVVSIVAPISATGAGIPVILGLLRGERATALQMLGIGLALVGIILASRTPSDATHADRATVTRSVGLGLLAALGFGAFFVLVDEAAATDVLWAGVVQRLTGVGIMTLASLALRPSFAIGWQVLPALILVGVLDTAANVLFAFSSRFGLVSVAAVLASLYPVVTVMLARIVLHERIARVQALGVASALGGVALIASG